MYRHTCDKGEIGEHRCTCSVFNVHWGQYKFAFMREGLVPPDLIPLLFEQELEQLIIKGLDRPFNLGQDVAEAPCFADSLTTSLLSSSSLLFSLGFISHITSHFDLFHYLSNPLDYNIFCSRTDCKQLKAI